MRSKEFFADYILPISMVAGSIIGVGFFSLPYITTRVGVWVMSAYFIALTLLVLFLHLMFAEISLKTPDKKRFPGFVGYYFGKWAQVYSIFSNLIIYFAVLLVYLMIGSQFLYSALNPYIGGSYLIYVLAYFLGVCVAIYIGISIVSKLEFFSLIFLFISFLLAFAKGIHEFNFSNIPLFGQIDLKSLFMPYGAIIFSLWGIGLIPEAEEMVENKKKSLKNIIFYATLIPAIFFYLFVIMIVGITGKATTESALIGLNDYLGDGVVIISLLMGFVITFSAFITHGLNLKKTIMFDLKIKERDAFIITCCVPLILLLLGFKSFVGLISFVGGILLGIDGILILLMYKKIVKKSWFVYPLMLVFLLGIIYQIIYFIK